MDPGEGVPRRFVASQLPSPSLQGTEAVDCRRRRPSAVGTGHQRLSGPQNADGEKLLTVLGRGIRRPTSRRNSRR